MCHRSRNTKSESQLKKKKKKKPEKKSCCSRLPLLAPDGLPEGKGQPQTPPPTENLPLAPVPPAPPLALLWRPPPLLLHRKLCRATVNSDRSDAVPISVDLHGATRLHIAPQENFRLINFFFWWGGRASLFFFLFLGFFLLCLVFSSSSPLPPSASIDSNNFFFFRIKTIGQCDVVCVCVSCGAAEPTGQLNKSPKNKIKNQKIHFLFQPTGNSHAMAQFAATSSSTNSSNSSTTAAGSTPAQVSYLP